MSQSTAESIKTTLFSIIKGKIKASDEEISNLISKAIEIDWDINEKSADGKSLLLSACTYESLQVAKELISRGADVNMSDDKDNSTSLINMACSKNNYELAKLLLEHGADPNVFDRSSDRFPLHYAVDSKNLEMIRLLVKYKADFHARINENYSSPFEFALSQGLMEIVIEAFKSGVTVKDINSKAFNLTCASGNFELMKFIFEKNVPADLDYSEVLYYACLGGNVEILNFLIENSSCFKNPSQINSFRLIQTSITKPDIFFRLIELNYYNLSESEPRELWELFYSACAQIKWDIARVLLEYLQDNDPFWLKDYNSRLNCVFKSKADGIYMHPKLKKHLFRWCCSGSGDAETLNQFIQNEMEIYKSSCNDADVNICDMLAKLGIDINERFNYEATPLEQAIISGKVDFVVKLIDSGAELNLRALEMALSSGSEKLASHLLPKVSTIDDPLIIACVSGNVNVLKMIISYISPSQDEIQRAFFTACQYGNLKMLNAILKLNHEQFDDADELGNSPFHLACMNETYEDVYLLQKLIYLGFNPDVCDNFDRTPLHIAVIEGKAKFVNFFTSPQFRLINKCLPSGDSPLHLACSHENEPKIVFNMINLLITRGADVNMKNQNGSTPLHVAVENECRCSYKIVKTLIKAGADKEIKDNQGRTAREVAIKNSSANFSYRNQLIINYL